jgi:prepilin-type N-terminal cleavage/methylation domain-containing protein
MQETNINFNITSGKGFTLIELIIAMLIIAILTSGGLYVYSGLISSSKVTATIKNITILETAANSYADINGGSYKTIEPSEMQADNLIPSSWNISGNWTYPINTDGLIKKYFIGQNIWGTSGNYVIGIYAPSITNLQALTICKALENSISAIGFNGNSYNLPQYRCSIVVPDNNELLSSSSQSEIFFGFN